jgi:hypothetical protein
MRLQIALARNIKSQFVSVLETNVLEANVLETKRVILSKIADVVSQSEEWL